MTTPIIIPIQSTRVVNCITQDGVRYCEDTPISKHSIGTGLILIVAVFAWLGFWMWFGEKKNWDIGTLLGISIFAPLLIAGLILIF